MPEFGFHIDPPLSLIPPILESTGLRAFQTVLRSPHRLAKEGIPDVEDQEGYRRTNAGLWGMVHGSLITNLAAPDPKIRNGSVGALASDANLAASLGLAGVCFHVGYCKGHETQDGAIEAVIYKLGDVLNRLNPGARVFLENGCEGTELGQTIGEVARVSQAVGSDDRLGFVLDTCHLHVAGFDMADPGAPEALADELDSTGLAPLLTALHLNDAKAPCGSKRDRHAAPGEGTIGDGLLRLIDHPFFMNLPCILEMGMEDALRGIAFLRGG